MFISKSLRVFVVLYQEKNMKKAANVLSLTVPPVARMLKLLEEQAGEALFIVERNRLVPTHLAESIYRRVIPHYYALRELGPVRERVPFRISSPYSHTLLMTDVMSYALHSVSDRATLRYAEMINDDDDIFISFHAVNASPYFNVVRNDISFALYTRGYQGDDWREKVLLTDRESQQLPEFRRMITMLRACGFNGMVRQIDNAGMLKQCFHNGEGMFFLPEIRNGYDDLTCLPLTYSHPFYIYTNKLKQREEIDDFCDALINFITGVVPVYD